MNNEHSLSVLREDLTAKETPVTMQQMQVFMKSMTTLLISTNERITEMEKEIRLLTKVTPAQASSLNSAVRERAEQLSEQYRCPLSETFRKAAANAIRRSIKLTSGVRSMKDLPRCEYQVALEQISMWDDYKILKDIKKKVNAT